MKKLNIGVCGLGFGKPFAELFKAHPLVEKVILCDLLDKRLDPAMRELEIEDSVRTFDELLETDVDGIAIFTQRWRHAPMAVRALKRGKHVYSAVPAAVTVEELDELVKTVEETGLTYVLGETSFYRPQTLWCRRKFADGEFGDFVYGEGQYYHDMAHWFYAPFYEANGPEWKKYASVPPMWYPTHSVSHVLSVTFSRFTKVSCFGYVDHGEDGLFDPEISEWGNAWSNQSALFQTADGGMARINEFRRTGAGESRQSIIGTVGAYEEQSNPSHKGHSVQDQIDGTGKESAASSAVWRQKYFEKPPKTKDGSFDYEQAPHLFKHRAEDMTWIHRLDGVEITKNNRGSLPDEYLGKRHDGVSPVHPVERLPKEFVGLRNGHCGSHQFLVQDFLESIDTGKLPPNHVWLAARYNIPGIMAHESCKKGGECLDIPDFGKPPEGSVCIDPLVALKD